MVQGQPPPAVHLPDLWLLSDQRNDAGLEAALARLPGGSGFVFRHYHLDEIERRARFAALALAARRHRHLVFLSDSTASARGWGADGVYGPPYRVAGAADMLAIATAHDAAELRAAADAGADAAMLSPVFPTRSHPDADGLGIARFRALAAAAPLPVIALGGMTAERARQLDHPRWAAIDGLA